MRISVPPRSAKSVREIAEELVASGDVTRNVPGSTPNSVMYMLSVDKSRMRILFFDLDVNGTTVYGGILKKESSAPDKLGHG